MQNPDLVKNACATFPGQIAVGIDARAGRVAVAGWAEQSSLAVDDLAKRFEDCGVSAIIFTDIDRDGLLSGINIDATAALAEAISIPVIASGGLSGLDDVIALIARRTSGIAGAISGRALYDGRLHAADVLALPEVR